MIKTVLTFRLDAYKGHTDLEVEILDEAIVLRASGLVMAIDRDYAYREDVVVKSIRTLIDSADHDDCVEIYRKITYVL
ncbi:hypothetical protein [Yersinia phage MHG19]|nr:hypothetical protein [Yersinia phage MHG19]